ncbi:SNF2-related protein [Penicillium longicatenatum]|nr:SNF2-related protein [Penicillium longicatenatum]
MHQATEEPTTSLSHSPPTPTALDSTETPSSPPLLSGPSNANRSPRPSASSIAPPGTSPAVQFSATIPRKTSPRSMAIAPSPAPSDAPNPQANMTVQFTSVKDEDNESDAKRSYNDMSEEDERTRSRGLIEEVYNVEERRPQPVKKMKVEDTSKPGTPSQQFRTSEGSELGQFMKKDQTNHAPSPAALGVVDLTTTPPKDNAEDDEIQFTGSNDLSTQRVCYGKIEGATINATLVPKPDPNSKFLFPDQWPIIKLELHRDPDTTNKRIEVSDPTGIRFGVIHSKVAPALCQLLDSPIIPLEISARLDMRAILPQEIPGEPTAANYRASLTLYGERQRAAMVGKFLSHQNVWLGVPPIVEKGTPVWNPHDEIRQMRAAQNAASTNNSMRERPAFRYEVRTAEEITDSVTKMFNQLVSADVPTMEPPDSVLTPLLHHQKQALWFMTEKEKRRKFGPEEADNNSLWRCHRNASGQKEYKEIITGTVCAREPRQVLGGLLADMMGLGKTLSILSLVLSSLSAAHKWENSPPPDGLARQYPGIRNTRTTLLVAPLSAVKNWTMQVEEHLKANSIKAYVFHGSGRITDLKELATYDLIITTYSTVLSELSSRVGRDSPFSKMNMFRIVLDEAHIIREQNAQQTKAILSLNAQRRWSVTGTPVQNRLEDLHSVLKFLRLSPYDDNTHFRQFIVSRFKTNDATVLTSLRVLIDSFTLRRVKDKINLPPRVDRLITLEFSDKEQQLHDYFRNESNAMMSHIVGENKTKMGGRMYHHVLKAMMLLRQVSAHGKELLDREDRERIKGTTMTDAIDLEENESDDGSSAAKERKAYQMYSLMQQTSADQCALCSSHLDEPLTSSGDIDRDAHMAVYLPCFDMLCPSCFWSWTEFHGQSGGEARCKACEGWITKSFTILTPGIIEDFDTQRTESQSNRKYGKILGDYERPHTKTLALVSHLRANLEESSVLVGELGEPPIKSVVFSAWTTHLDLIEIALKNNGLDTFTRLDGTMSLAARGKALDAFAKDNNITILLATIGAGGVGLNLTSASRVYIMEPQYNPAAVAQAVDRVHRLGQTRPVQTIQFIMKNSIEEKILELAKKKQQLADMSMNRSKQDKKEVQEQRMQEYRSLFK